MKFKEFIFIYISRDYMRKMHDVESEIFFMDTEQYEKKPHVDFKQDPTLGLEENQRRGLMYKEYRFCLNIKDDVEKKAKKIYENQIKKGKVLKYHCDYKKLEEVCNQYIVENNEKWY